MSARIAAENATLFAKADALDGLAKACMSFGSDELSGEAYTALAAYYADCIAPYLSSVRTVVLEKAALNTSYQSALGSLSLAEYDDEDLLARITAMQQKIDEMLAPCSAGDLPPVSLASPIVWYASSIDALHHALEEFHAFEDSVSGLYSTLDTYTGYLDQMTAAIDGVRAVFSPDRPEGVSGEEIAQRAMTYLGTPYVFGAEDLDHAVDCSGFVRSLFGLFGFSFDGNANAFATNTSATNGTTCTAVPLDELKPGDIVARLSPGGHGHVGIYIGNGQYINASGGSANYDMAHAGTGVTISPIPTGDNVYAWRVDELVEKEDAASLWGKMQDAVNSCTDSLSLNPLYVSALYETAHPDEAACFDSLNEGLRGLPVEDRLGVKNVLYGQDGDGASMFEENDCKRIVAKSLGNGISCRVSESGQTRVLPDSHNAGDGSCVVEISEADLANGRQDGYYEVFRAIGNGVDISGKSISPSGQVWSDIARSGMTISEAAKNDSNCFSRWCAGQGVGTPYGSRMNAQALDALLSGSAPTSPLPGTDPGLEGNQAYFADYFAKRIRGKANDTNSYTPQTDAHMRHILNDILQAYGG